MTKKFRLCLVFLTQHAFEHAAYPDVVVAQDQPPELCLRVQVANRAIRWQAGLHLRRESIPRHALWCLWWSQHAPKPAEPQLLEGAEALEATVHAVEPPSYRCRMWT